MLTDMLSAMLSSMGALSLGAAVIFFYKFVKAFFELIKIRTSCKTYYATIKDLKDSRISYKNTQITGRVFYYDAEVEGLKKIALYTEKTKGNTKSKLKYGDRLKVYYNAQYNYTIDYKEKTSNVISNFLWFLCNACVAVAVVAIPAIILIYFL